MDEHCDAIVVGAGPAGSALATFLARAGWDTVLIDAASFPRAKVCGECLSAAAMPVLQELGIEQQVRDTATVQHALRIVLPGTASLELALDESSFESVLGISRHRLDWLLLEQARASGARLLLEHRVRRLAFAGARVVGVAVADVANRERQPVESRVLHGRIVIAADGRFSTIVRETGRVVSRGPRLVGFKRHRNVANAPRCATDEIRMVSLHGGYVGLCDVEGAMENICGLMPRAALRRARGSIDAALANLLRGYDRQESLDIEDTQSPWMTMPDVRQQRSVPRTEGVLYVGDALGTIEPLAGQGLAMALVGANLAAELLLSNDRRMANEALQRRYAALWQSHFGRTIDRAQRLGWLLRRPSLLYPLARLAPGTKRLEDLLFRATYRGTRLRVNEPVT
jgi:flavin-dependent dehydrogenase